MKGWKNPYLLKKCLNSNCAEPLANQGGFRGEVLSKQRRIKQLSSPTLEGQESRQIMAIRGLMKDGHRALFVVFRQSRSFTDAKQ